MKISPFNHSLLAVLFVALTLTLSSCASSGIGGTTDVSDVNRATFDFDSTDVFQASMSALNGNGFVIRRSNNQEGVIRADFINPGARGDEDRFYGYSSRVSRHVTAEINLVRDEVNGLTHLTLNLIEVFPPSPSQYGSANSADTSRQLNDRKYYESLLEEIEFLLNF
ncbi:MAG: hypothetical protein LAT84_12900 [Balneolia bacterium]|nr:hypothetical protein [Balneolia bacterium]